MLALKPHRPKRFASQALLRRRTYGRAMERLSQTIISLSSRTCYATTAPDIRLLLLKSIHNEHIDGREGVPADWVVVQAWTVLHNARSPRWKFQTAGSDGQALYEHR